LQQLFTSMRGLGLQPKRSAGGGHVNVDLAPLKALPEKEGARALANLIAFFESRREMISQLWQHPYRERVAIPVETTMKFRKELDAFDGNWKELGELLYDNRYFNPLVGRKPVYTQMNATALMAAAVPEAYQKPIDIKRPGEVWFPSFGGKGKDRIEFRLFDAPTNENTAALQIKYVRALLDRSFNATKPISIESLYPANAQKTWKEDPALFYRDAKTHLEDLGLSPDEFAPVLIEAARGQQATPKPKDEPIRYEGF